MMGLPRCAWDGAVGGMKGRPTTNCFLSVSNSFNIKFLNLGSSTSVAPAPPESNPSFPAPAPFSPSPLSPYTATPVSAPGLVPPVMALDPARVALEQPHQSPSPPSTLPPALPSSPLCPFGSSSPNPSPLLPIPLPDSVSPYSAHSRAALSLSSLPVPGLSAKNSNLLH